MRDADAELARNILVSKKREAWRKANPAEAARRAATRGERSRVASGASQLIHTDPLALRAMSAFKASKRDWMPHWWAAFARSSAREYLAMKRA